MSGRPTVQEVLARYRKCPEAVDRTDETVPADLEPRAPNTSVPITPELEIAMSQIPRDLPGPVRARIRVAHVDLARQSDAS